MSVDVEPRRRIATALTWPLGMSWTTLHYTWRILPVYRREADGRVPDDLPPELPDDVSHEHIQGVDHGAGPLFHRLYSCEILDAALSAEELIAALGADPNDVAPWQIARFRKTHGAETRLNVGDEFLVHMPGPWNGPVRVIEVRPDGFRFATLDGHIEAGQIEWRAWVDDGRLHFGVESWARGGDRLSAFVHDRLRMAKEVQLYMWTSVCENAPRVARGRLADGVNVLTHRVPPEVFT